MPLGLRVNDREPNERYDVQLVNLSLFSPQTARRKKRQILTNVTFEANTGDFVGIIGSSGSGKTSLFNALIGAYNLTAYKAFGSMSFSPRCIKHLPRINFVLASETSYPCLTVEEFLFFLGCLNSLPSTFQQIRAHIEVLLKSFQLEDYRNCLIFSSVGRPILPLSVRKRISLCRALLNQPNLLFLDEITSDLCEEEIESIFRVLKYQNIKRSDDPDDWCCTLCTLHQPSKNVFFFLDKVILLNEGSVLYCGSPHQLQHYLTSRFSFLQNLQWDNDNIADVAIYACQLDRYFRLYPEMHLNPSCSSINGVNADVFQQEIQDNIQKQSQVAFHGVVDHVASLVESPPIYQNFFNNIIITLSAFWIQYAILVRIRWIRQTRNKFNWLLFYFLCVVQGFILAFAYSQGFHHKTHTVSHPSFVFQSNLDVFLYSLDRFNNFLEKHFDNFSTVANELSPGVSSFETMVNDLNLTTVAWLLHDMNRLVDVSPHFPVEIPEKNLSFESYLHMLRDAVPILYDIFRDSPLNNALAALKNPSVLSLFIYLIKSPLVNSRFALDAQKIMSKRFPDLFLHTSSHAKGSIRLLSEINMSDKNSSRVKYNQTLHDASLLELFKLFRNLSISLHQTLEKVPTESWLQKTLWGVKTSQVLDVLDTLGLHLNRTSSMIHALIPQFRLNTLLLSIFDGITALQQFVMEIFKSFALVTDLASALLFLVLFLGSSSFLVLFTFIQERSFVNRDLHQKLYSPLAFFLSRITVELPFQLVSNLSMASAFYFVAGLYHLPDHNSLNNFIRAKHFFVFLVTCALITIASYAFVSMVSYLAISLEMALSIITFILILWLTSIGFLLRDTILPAWIEPLQASSFYRWGFFALAQNVTFDSQMISALSRQLSLRLMGVKGASLIFSCCMLSLCALAYFTFGFIFFLFLHKQHGVIV